MSASTRLPAPRGTQGPVPDLAPSRPAIIPAQQMHIGLRSALALIGAHGSLTEPPILLDSAAEVRAFTGFLNRAGLPTYISAGYRLNLGEGMHPALALARLLGEPEWVYARPGHFPTADVPLSVFRSFAFPAAYPGGQSRTSVVVVGTVVHRRARRDRAGFTLELGELSTPAGYDAPPFALAHLGPQSHALDAVTAPGRTVAIVGDFFLIAGGDRVPRLDGGPYSLVYPHGIAIAATPVDRPTGALDWSTLVLSRAPDPLDCLALSLGLAQARRVEPPQPPPPTRLAPAPASAAAVANPGDATRSEAPPTPTIVVRTSSRSAAEHEERVRRFQEQRQYEEQQRQLQHRERQRRELEEQQERQRRDERQRRLQEQDLAYEQVSRLLELAADYFAPDDGAAPTEVAPEPPVGTGTLLASLVATAIAAADPTAPAAAAAGPAGLLAAAAAAPLPDRAPSATPSTALTPGRAGSSASSSQSVPRVAKRRRIRSRSCSSVNPASAWPAQAHASAQTISRAIAASGLVAPGDDASSPTGCSSSSNAA